MSEKTRIFLSYSSKDSSLARHIQTYLVSSGAHVWFDEYEIRVGDSIIGKIQQGLKACSHVIVLLTGNSVRSGWVEQEWKSKFWQEVESGHVSVIPLLAESCEIPTLLQGKKYADIRGDNITKGMNDVLHAIGLSKSRHQTRESEIIMSQALDLLTINRPEQSEIKKTNSWSTNRKIAAISAALYSHPVRVSDVQQDFIDFSGLSEQISYLAMTSASKVIIYGQDGLGKTSLLHSITSSLTANGARVIVCDPHEELEEGDCCYLSYMLLKRFCNAGLLGAAVAHVERLLSEGLDEGGLWYSGVSQGSRFLDSVLEKLWKLGEMIVILIDNLDADWHDFQRGELSDEFLHFTVGSYIVTGVTGGEDWISKYVNHQIEIPKASPETIIQIIKKRLSSFPFDASDIVQLDPAIGSFLLDVSSYNLRRIFDLCRQTLNVHKCLSISSLEQIIGNSSRRRQSKGESSVGKKRRSGSKVREDS